MRLRILFAAFCFAAFIIVTASAQFADPALRQGVEHGSSIVTGSVYSRDGTSLGGVRVEIRVPTNGTVVASTYSQPNGAFTLYNVPAGSYQLVAQDGGAKSSQLISTYSAVNSIDLTLDGGNENAGRDGTVSVAQLKVPQKARDRCSKGQEEFAKGRYEQAQKAVNEAIAIFPRYAEAITLRGLLALQKGNSAHAMSDFQEAISYDPSYGLAYTALSSIYNNEGICHGSAEAVQGCFPGVAGIFVASSTGTEYRASSAVAGPCAGSGGSEDCGT